MIVKLKESWGSDESTIVAARMSTDGSFRGWDKDLKLLKYLWDNKHLTPFEMSGATFEIYAPIFVARQWMRHRTFSYNEMSGRYVELPEDSYCPLFCLRTDHHAQDEIRECAEMIAEELKKNFPKTMTLWSDS